MGDDSEAKPTAGCAPLTGKVDDRETACAVGASCLDLGEVENIWLRRLDFAVWVLIGTPLFSEAGRIVGETLLEERLFVGIRGIARSWPDFGDQEAEAVIQARDRTKRSRRDPFCSGRFFTPIDT